MSIVIVGARGLLAGPPGDGDARPSVGAGGASSDMVADVIIDQATSKGYASRPIKLKCSTEAAICTQPM